jgi:hypothetical protein
LSSGDLLGGLAHMVLGSQSGAQMRMFCHPERSEGSAFRSRQKQILRFAQDDKRSG